MNLQQIESQCRTLDEARSLLSLRVQGLEADLDAARKKALPAIKAAVRKAAAAQAELRASVEAAPELFAKPKTQVFHGVQVGYRKGKGTMEWEDDDALVAKIRKAFGDEADQYLIIKPKPSKTALNELEAKALRALGVTVEEAGDVVVVKPVDGDVDKLVKALLKDALDQAQEDAA